MTVGAAVGGRGRYRWGRAPHLVVGALIVALATVALPNPAGAQATDDFAVYPAGSDPTTRPFFAYELRPGDVIDDVVTIVNYSSQPRTFDTYAADGYNTSDVGTFALRQPEERSVGVGEWVSLGVGRWTVPAEGEVDIAFRLEVPSDATPGDHVGGIMALQLAEPADDAEGFGLSVRRGIGARIYLRIAGPLQPALAVDVLESTHSSPLLPFGSGSATTSFRVTNTGNVRMSPSASLRVTGPFGEIEDVNLGEFADLLPGNSVEVSHEWSGVPAGGEITQTVTLADGDLRVTRAISFWVFPWWLLVLVGVLVLAAYLAARLVRRRDREPVAADLARAAAIVLVALAASQMIDAGAAAAADAELFVQPEGEVAPGDRITVSGLGWPASSNLMIEICGNEAARSTLDCAVTEGRTAATSPDGRFAVEMGVAEPPAPCPCVVRAWSVSGTSTTLAVPLVLSGVDVAGPGDGNGAQEDPEPDAPSLQVDARLVGSDSWSAWFGGGARRTLVLDLVNTGDIAIAGPVASLAQGTGDQPIGYVPLASIGRLGPGERREHRVDVRFDPLTVGDLKVQGEIVDAGRPVVFAAEGTTYPWGLILVAAAVLPVLFLAIWAPTRARRRRVRDAGPDVAVSTSAELEAPPAVVDFRPPEHAAPEIGAGEPDELESVISQEIATLFDRLLGARARGELDEFDDSTFVRLVVEMSRRAAARVARRVPLSPSERTSLDEEMADAMLESFGFVRVEVP